MAGAGSGGRSLHRTENKAPSEHQVSVRPRRPYHYCSMRRHTTKGLQTAGTGQTGGATNSRRRGEGKRGQPMPKAWRFRATTSSSTLKRARARARRGGSEASCGESKVGLSEPLDATLT